MESKKQCPSGARQLREILLGYLHAAGSVAAWPGGEGLTLEDILDCYPEAVARGEVPDWQQLLRAHPELAAELHAWLAAKDRWRFTFRPDPCAQPGTAGQGNTEGWRRGNS